MQTLKETQAFYETSLSLEQVLMQALRLSPLQKIRLVEKLMSVLEKELTTEVGLATQAQPLRSLLGLLAEFGPAPSAEEIDEARREMWATFPREDI